MGAIPLSLLVIDDNADDREFYANLLARDVIHEWSIRESKTGQEGLNLLRQEPFDCVLLDYSLPGANGMRVLNELRLENLTVPVVMLTGQGNEQIAVEAMKNGAQDYMAKDQASATTLLNAINNAIAHKKQELTLLRRANYDELTGLTSRYAFMEHLNRAIARADRTKKVFALLFMDLDQFKQVNDVHGHSTGDALLQEVARRLSLCVRECDTLARLSGDEFVVILEELTENGMEGCNIVANRIIESVSQQPFLIGESEICLQISMGIAIYPFMARNKEELMEIADKAMYNNKKSMEHFFMFASGSMYATPNKAGHKHP